MTKIPIRIGLEIHAQLKTRTKLFCSCRAQTFGMAPNHYICPTCSGQPGSLPVLNQQAVELSIKAALAIGSKVQLESYFDRKTYQYADLPKGYQITQHRHPIARGGGLFIRSDGRKARVGIQRIHLEEDTGKLVYISTQKKTEALLDLNRSGVPLIEIVTYPELTTPEDTAQFLDRLRTLLTLFDICSGAMEQGAFRCDANISLMDQKGERSTTPVEIKNLNSFHHIRSALSYEANRLVADRNHTKNTLVETRGWDETHKKTYYLRTKPRGGYRYIPDPDLPPIRLSLGLVQQIKEGMPELPFNRADRIAKTYGLSIAQSEVFAFRPTLSDFFEECVRSFRHVSQVSHWVLHSIHPILNRQNREIHQTCLNPHHLIDLLKRVNDGRITDHLARNVLPELMEHGGSVQELLTAKGVEPITSQKQVEDLVRKIISSHPRERAEYNQGRTNVLHFFIGQVMKATRGQAEPIEVRKAVEKRLKEV